MGCWANSYENGVERAEGTVLASPSHRAHFGGGAPINFSMTWSFTGM